MKVDDSEPPTTMTVPEVGEAIGVSRNLAYQLARDGVIPSLRLGRRIVVPRVAFERWLATAGLGDREVPDA